MRCGQRYAQLVVILVLVFVWGVPLAWAASTPMVAIILPRDNIRFQVIHEAFLRSLEKTTASTGNPRFYLQSPSADIMSLRNSIRKATALGADLIVVYGTRAATAAKLEDFTEPLIFADVFEPVAMGLVPSLARGGSLITGVCGQGPSTTLLKTLQETAGTIRLGVPIEPKYQAAAVQAEVLRKAACRRGEQSGDGSHMPSPGDLCWLEIVTTGMQSPNDMIKALKAVEARIDAVFLSDLVPSDGHAQALLDYAALAGLPVVSQVYGTADKGAFITLEADPEEQGELLAGIAQRLLDGAMPEDVPPVQPRRVSLTINLRVAKQLGIAVPFPVLLQTTRVIR